MDEEAALRFKQLCTNLEQAHVRLIELLFPTLMLHPCLDIEQRKHPPHHFETCKQHLGQGMALWRQVSERSTSMGVTPDLMVTQFKLPGLPELDTSSCLKEGPLEARAAFRTQLERASQLSRAIKRILTEWWTLAKQIHKLLFVSIRNVGAMAVFQYDTVWANSLAHLTSLYHVERDRELQSIWQFWQQEKRALSESGKQLYARWKASIKSSLEVMPLMVDLLTKLMQESLTTPGELAQRLTTFEDTARVLIDQVDNLPANAAKVWAGTGVPVLGPLLLSAEKWWHEVHRWINQLVDLVQTETKQQRSRDQQQHATESLSGLLQSVQEFEIHGPEEKRKQRVEESIAKEAQEARTELLKEIRYAAPERVGEARWKGIRQFLQGATELTRLQASEREHVLAQLKTEYQKCQRLATERQQAISSWYHRTPGHSFNKDNKDNQDNKDNRDNRNKGSSWLDRLLGVDLPASKGDKGEKGEKGKSLTQSLTQSLSLGRETDPKTVEWLSKLEEEMSRLQDKMSEIYLHLERKVIPEYLENLHLSGALGQVLQLLDDWPSKRQQWLQLYEEECVYLQNCLDIRTRLFETLHDEMARMHLVHRLEMRVQRDALRLFVRNLFQEYLNRHLHLAKNLRVVWKDTTRQVERHLVLLAHLNKQLSLSCPEASQRILHFNTQIQQTIQDIQKSLEKHYLAGFHQAVHQHAQYVLHFLNNVQNTSGHPLAVLTQQLDKVCDHQNRLFAHVSNSSSTLLHS